MVHLDEFDRQPGWDPGWGHVGERLDYVEATDVAVDAQDTVYVHVYVAEITPKSVLAKQQARGGPLLPDGCHTSQKLARRRFA